MMRALAIVQMLVVLGLLLYLPAVQPAEQWATRLHMELGLHAAAWGPRQAKHILDDALQRSAGLRQAAPALHAEPTTPARGPIDAAMATQLSAATARLTDSAYIRALEMLMTVALFRLSALLSLLPALAGPALAMLTDGFVRRRIKSREFGQHHPEAFAAGLAGMLVTLGVTAVASIAPATVHPFFLLSLPLVFFLAACLAIANYHARA